MIDDRAQETADWAFISYALSDAARGMTGRWAESATSTGGGRRTASHDKLLRRLAQDLAALSEVVGTADFAAGRRRADVALADAVAGPLAALGEDLRAAFREVNRAPAYDD